MKGVIYKIVSPSGRVYIGQSTDVKSRKRSYKNNANQNQRLLRRSLLKYGFGNHSFDIIEDSIPELLLDEREIFWVAEFDSCDNGLNLTYGGKSGKRTKEWCETMSAIRKANPTGAVGKSGKNHYNYGKKASNELKLILSEAHKGKRAGKDNNMFKGYIEAYKDGIYVDTYEGVNDAAAKLNLHHPLISKVILGKRKTTGGYSFKRITA